MSGTPKNQEAILKKLGIAELNPMQIEAQQAIHSNKEVLLLSPTGSGKTVAFLLPIISNFHRELQEVQAIIVVPSRELAIQIEQVAREMGAGFKTNAVYGGRNVSKDKIELKHPPTLLVGTPGRIADHLRRNTFSVDHVQTLILDEYDKSLEVGFEDEMSEIVAALPDLDKKILTSATKEVDIPYFVGFKKPKEVNFLDDGVQKLAIKTVISPTKDKLATLVDLLKTLGTEPGIIFCNFKDSIRRVSECLRENGVDHGCFYGGLEQVERERALIKFRNGTHQLLLATDLAARGLDVPEIKFIVHYHLPMRSQEFTHRNGRTARMHADGTAYVLAWEDEVLPEFINTDSTFDIDPNASDSAPSEWSTVFVSGGRKDKISKGDIAGLFCKQGKLSNDQIGVIELKQDCAFVAVKKNKVNQMIQLIDNSRLKKKKVRIKVV